MAEAAVAQPGWLAARRERAASLSGELPLPQWKGNPGWEFTDLSGLDLDAYPTAKAAGEAAALETTDPLFWRLPAATHLDQVDGTPLETAHPDTTAPLPDGALVLPLDRAAAEHPELVERHLGTVVAGGDDAFVARNDAEWAGGVLVYVPSGARLEAPVVVSAVQAAAGTTLHWRTLIVVEEGGEAEVWEQYLSADPELDAVFNTVVELVVGQNARLRYVCGQQLSQGTSVFGSQRAEVGRDGRLDWVAVGFGSARGRVRMETKLAGAGADAKVTGAYAGSGRQHLDFDTTQEHAAPNTTSDLAFRGVLQNRSTSVWRGMIKVDPGAQRTDAFQESRNLLLSKRAHADAIPGLEIEANDVRCTHAAAIAQVDAEQLFYLMSHGLPRPEATRLVVHGFMQQLVERFEEGPVREALGLALDRRIDEILV